MTDCPTTSSRSRKKRLLMVILALVILAPVKVLADIVEYALILALIAILVIVALKVLPQPGARPVLRELQTTILAAKNANASGNARQELSQLSKSIGLAEALMGMAASCDQCGEFRTDLQAVIGLASKLRARLITGGTCNPNGVISSSEQCDPLADPTGCPATSIPTFCDDQCICEAIATSTTTTTAATTSTTTIACAMGQMLCGAVCVDTSSDPNNCGGCGIVCPTIMPSCVGGVCTIL